MRSAAAVVVTATAVVAPTAAAATAAEQKDENDDESVIPEIDRTAFKRYVEAGVIQGGMIPKLENSFQAINAGVKQVIITQASDIHLRKGTRVF